MFETELVGCVGDGAMSGDVRDKLSRDLEIGSAEAMHVSEDVCIAVSLFISQGHMVSTLESEPNSEKKILKRLIDLFIKV